MTHLKMKDDCLAKGWAKLTHGEQKKLIKLFGLISEASYRRGVQQGARIERHECFARNIYKWRFEVPLTLSPWIDQRIGKSSVNRMLVEYGSSLSDILGTYELPLTSLGNYRRMPHASRRSPGRSDD